MKTIPYYIELFLGLTLFGVIFSSCNDEIVDSSSSGSGQINFRVTTKESDIWHPGNPSSSVDTRGGHRGSGIVSLDGWRKSLYLVPKVTEGIEIDKEAKPTRSRNYDKNTLPSFGVYATTSHSIEKGEGFSADYMRNVEVKRENDWEPEANYLWPGKGTLHFNAYAPYQQAGTPDGIISLPVEGSSYPIITYKTPSDVADQTDLLYADPTDASSSPCDLTFSHALTAIEFAAGAELVPCKINTISISGVKSFGKLDIESGSWELGDEMDSFSVSPSITLAADEGSEYVKQGTPVTRGSDVMLLLPQVLSSDSQLEIELEYEGKTLTLTACLGGQIWAEGTTVTYRISANPVSDQLVLGVAGSFESPFTGTTLPYKVSSYLEDNGERIPVKWTAEFVDDAGNVIDRPVWITSFIMEGEGEENLQGVTQMNDIAFTAMSSATRILLNAQDINSTSGYSPFNLSSSDGGPGIENTANTYLINAPGNYAIPLVYGNAIENGVTNNSAFISTKTGSSIMKTFVNHLGNPISDPYIYNNTGCVPSSALLIWEDQLNTIREIKLSADKKWINFTIPQNSIREGNALIAVQDASGNVMWSWHLWLTDVSLQSGAIEIPGAKGETTIFSKNIGEVEGGDKVNFPAASVNVRFTQIGLPEDVKPLTKTIKIVQAGKETETPAYTIYYQWGRKDPMISPNQTFYSADHVAYDGIPEISNSSLTEDGADLWSYLIQHPQTFLQAAHSEKFDYLNLWSTNEGYTATTVRKTIYDPSPVGYRVPAASMISYLSTNGTKTFVNHEGLAGYEVAGSGYNIFFPAFGYISGETLHLESFGDASLHWTCRGMDKIEAYSLQIKKLQTGTISFKPVNDPRTHGFGVRPVNEH